MTSWTPEFCTVCDKQCILGNVYCSDGCRELDMRKSEQVSDTASALSSHSTNFSSHETSESSDEEDFPALTLSKQLSNQIMNTSSKPPAPRPKRKEFLYASPVLKPSKGPAISPSVSPLLMPQVSPDPTEQISAQSVSTYKRWLAEGRQ